VPYVLQVTQPAVSIHRMEKIPTLISIKKCVIMSKVHFDKQCQLHQQLVITKNLLHLPFSSSTTL